MKKKTISNSTYKYYNCHYKNYTNALAKQFKNKKKRNIITEEAILI